MRIVYAFSCAAFIATSEAVSVTPVQKVIQLLENFQNQVKDLGTAEAAAYETFSCFCKNETSITDGWVGTGKESISSLETKLASQTAQAEKLGLEIADLNKKIDQDSVELEELNKKREVQVADYRGRDNELASGLDAIKRAVTHIQNASPLSVTSLVEVKALAKRYLEPDFTNRTPGAAADEVYDFHSGGIINLLGNLETKLKEKRAEIGLEFTKADEDFQRESGALTTRIEESKSAVSTKSTNRANALQEAAEAQASLAAANKKLKYDSAYLASVTADCEAKGREWDERTSLRAGELVAISKALAIMKGTVKDLEKVNIPDPSLGLVQMTARRSTLSLLKAGARHGVSFLQEKRSTIRRAAIVSEDVEVDGRSDAVAALLGVAKKYKSGRLYGAAMSVSADPFSKVKQMLRDLIERLLKEGNEEATHHGWCTSNIAMNEKKQHYITERVAVLNARIEETTARKDKLETDTKTLTSEIETLKNALASATQQRQTDAANNAETISEASTAITAVDDAIKTLADFYKIAEKTVAKPLVLLQTERARSLNPWNSRYGGDQDQGSSIIGMLEVIRDNFKGSKATTEQEEAKAASLFDTFKRETDATVSSKSTSVKNFTEEANQCTADIGVDKEDLRLAEAELAAVKEELGRLNDACTDKGMTAEQRAKRLADEIAALKTAFKALGGSD